MENKQIEKIISSAYMIVDGYAFTKTDNKVRILNLNNLKKASVLSIEGELLETSMDDIELALILNIFHKNKEFLED